MQLPLQLPLLSSVPLSVPLLMSSLLRQYLQLDPGRLRARAPDGMRLRLEVSLGRLKNVRNPGLRIAIDDRKP